MIVTGYGRQRAAPRYIGRFDDYGVAPVVIAAAPAVAKAVKAVTSLFGGKSTKKNPPAASIGGLPLIADEGKSFTLTRATTVIYGRHEGASKTVNLPAGTHRCGNGLAGDPKKGYRKGCYADPSAVGLAAAVVPSVPITTVPSAIPQLTAAAATLMQQAQAQVQAVPQITAEQMLLAQQAQGVPTQPILAGFDVKALLIPGAIGLGLYAVLGMRGRR